MAGVLRLAVFNAEKRKKAHGMRRKVEDYEQPNSYSAVVTVRVYACVRACEEGEIFYLSVGAACGGAFSSRCQ